MASPDILDFEALLAPVAGDNPAGRALRRGDRAYDDIRDAADRARIAEKKLFLEDGVDSHGEPTSLPDWKPVLKSAPKALAEESKDLRLVAALIEALVREAGFAGLRDGFRLARELVCAYWENLYPLPDEDGVSTRVAALTHLNGEEGNGALLGPVLRIPITEGKSFGPFSTADYQAATALELVTDAEKLAQREAEPGAVTTQMFRRAVSETSPKFFTELREDIEQCRKEFAALGEVLEEKCGKDEGGYSAAPPNGAIREVLERCGETVAKIARDVAGPPPTDEAPGDGKRAPQGVDGDFRGAVRNREEAFLALLRVADYFKRAEPHSPVSYALEQAVRWGRMSLPDLLSELVPEEALREQLFKRVGIVAKEGPPS